jgi:hypothetical protein
MKGSGENLDMMLFDYLEGNYSEERASQIEKEIASDPLIQEELSLWKSTYIQAAWPDTSVLEATLVQKSIPSLNFTFFLNSILVICLTFFSSTNTPVDPLFESSHELFHADELSAKKPVFLITNELEWPEIGMINDSPPIETSNIRETELIQEVNQTVSIASLPALENISPGFNDFSTTAPLSMVERANTKPTPITKKIDRKTSRAYRKMLNKGRNDRMAKEFMKGDVPYVVPVDPSNF